MFKKQPMTSMHVVSSSKDCRIVKDYNNLNYMIIDNLTELTSYDDCFVPMSRRGMIDTFCKRNNG